MRRPPLPRNAVLHVATSYARATFKTYFKCEASYLRHLTLLWPWPYLDQVQNLINLSPGESWTDAPRLMDGWQKLQLVMKMGPELLTMKVLVTPLYNKHRELLKKSCFRHLTLVWPWTSLDQNRKPSAAYRIISNENIQPLVLEILR